jgi:hypothetical protein
MGGDKGQSGLNCGWVAWRRTGRGWAEQEIHGFLIFLKKSGNERIDSY